VRPGGAYRIVVDEEKAALHGISPSSVTNALTTVLKGSEAGLLHSQSSREDIPIMVRMTRADRSSLDALESTKLIASDGALVSLREITRTVATTLASSIYHKKMKRVVYVTGDVAGEALGYKVISVLGFSGSLNWELLKQPIRVVVIGHGASWVDRQDLIMHFHEGLPSVPIVALLRKSDLGFDGADFNCPGDNPLLWIRTVARALTAAREHTSSLRLQYEPA